MTTGEPAPNLPANRVGGSSARHVLLSFPASAPPEPPLFFRVVIEGEADRSGRGIRESYPVSPVRGVRPRKAQIAQWVSRTPYPVRPPVRSAPPRFAYDTQPTREHNMNFLPHALDVKGKDTALFDRTLVAPNAKPWHALDAAQVRYRATTMPAVLLSKGERQAAARDPGLEWDEAQRTYRPRRLGSPPPPLAKGGSADEQGGTESFQAPTSQTGAGQ